MWYFKYFFIIYIEQFYFGFKQLEYESRVGTSILFFVWIKFLMYNKIIIYII